MNAEILSYSRSKGLFAGISLEGSTLRSEGSANEKLYKQKLSARDIIRGGKVKAPPAAHDLIALLKQKDAKEQIRSQVAAVDGLTWIGPVLSKGEGTPALHQILLRTCATPPKRRSHRYALRVFIGNA